MELGDAIRHRRMCRDFSPEPVGADVVDRLVDRARRAPSAGHTQGWAFLALEGPEQTGRFWTADAEPSWLASPSLPGLLRAPVVVIPWCSEAAYRRRYGEADKAGTGSGPGADANAGTPDNWDVPYWLVDVSFATMLLLLGVEEEGLGALFFRLRPGATEKLRDEFGVPPEWSPIGAVAIGHPAGASWTGGEPQGSARRGRRPLSEVMRKGGW